MAIGDNYITTAQVKAWMSITGTQYDAIIDDVVSSISRDIEDYCNRQFNDAGSASARVFYPANTGLCIVDDFSTTAGLSIATDDDDDGVYETGWTTVDYQLEPLNGIRNGITGEPYWRIVAIGQQNSFHAFKRASVRVTAQWGWSAVPKPVLQAAKLLAADTFQLKDSRMGIAGSDAFGTVVRVRDSVVAKARLKKYIRGSVYVA